MAVCQARMRGDEMKTSRMKRKKSNICVPRRLFEDLLYMSQKYKDATPASEVVLLDINGRNPIKTIDYCKTISEAENILESEEAK